MEKGRVDLCMFGTGVVRNGTWETQNEERRMKNGEWEKRESGNGEWTWEVESGGRAEWGTQNEEWGVGKAGKRKWGRKFVGCIGFISNVRIFRGRGINLWLVNRL
jgi:hypothetical protein